MNKLEKSTKVELNNKIGQFLITNKKLNSHEVAKKFGVSHRTVSAIKAHVKMDRYGTKVEAYDFSLNGLTAKEINSKIAQYLLRNPEVELNVVANSFKVTTRKIGAIRAHISRGNYILENAPKVEVVKPKKVKKTIKVKKTEREYGDKKMVARKLQVSYILKSEKTHGTILTLSGQELSMELMLSTDDLGKNFNYDIVEQDKETFNNILKNPITHSINVSSISHITMRDLILNSPSNKYSHAILDYFDCLSTNKNDIANALDKNIVQVGGIIALTLSCRTKRGTKLIGDENECATIKEIKSFLSKFEGYEVIESMSYSGGSNGVGSPMVLLIIKRLK